MVDEKVLELKKRHYSSNFIQWSKLFISSFYALKNNQKRYREFKKLWQRTYKPEKANELYSNVLLPSQCASSSWVCKFPKNTWSRIVSPFAHSWELWLLKFSVSFFIDLSCIEWTYKKFWPQISFATIISLSFSSKTLSSNFTAFCVLGNWWLSKE